MPLTYRILLIISSLMITNVLHHFLVKNNNNVFAFTGLSSKSRTKVFQTAIHMSSTVPRMAASSETENVARQPQNIVIIGGGIQGSAVAYYLAAHAQSWSKSIQITILEAEELASAASGKGGGFMARSWADGSSTQRLHELSFDLFESLATTLPLQSYRKLPVLSVQPAAAFKMQSLNNPTKKGKGWNAAVEQVMPRWLDGSTGQIGLLGSGDDTAQVTPLEVAKKLVEKSRATVCYGTATGIVTTRNTGDEKQQVTGVIYKPRQSGLNNDNGDGSTILQQTLQCDTVVVCAGPWSCIAEDWFPDSGMKIPMQGIKSTSIVWKAPEEEEATVDATALFCGEDNQFGTHLEVYPRPDNTIYICGIGGSDYIDTEQLKAGAFRDQCLAKASRVEAAVAAFTKMSSTYRKKNDALDRVQACMRPCPPDALPYMGSIPGYSGAFLNAGHNCWGIAWAPGCGRAMAELILEGRCTSLDLSPFDPARFSPTSSKRGRKKGTMNVGEQW